MTATEDDLERDTGPGREPPNDLSAERQVLGSMMWSTDAIDDVTAVLTGGRDFYRPGHETIYDAMLALYENGKPVDPLTVTDELRRRGELARVGGQPYLAQVFHLVSSPAGVGYHAQIVAEQAVRRRVIDTAGEVRQQAYAGMDSPHELVEKATAKLQQAVGVVHTYTSPMDIYQQIMDAADGRGPVNNEGWPWGFYDLDAALKPLSPGQVVVLAARPGVGKSALLNNFMAHMTLHKKTLAEEVVYGRSLIVGMEMTAAEVWQRVAAGSASVPLHHLNNPERHPMTDADWQRMSAKGRELFETERMHIEYAPNCSVADVRAMIRYHRPHVVGIDYLQIMKMGGGENRQQEVAATMRQLVLLAHSEHVGIVLLSQLNRGPEHRADKLPQLSDLRESGAIEQDAHAVLFLHRPDAYERESHRMGEADIFCAKQRSGPSGWVATVAAQLHFQRFVDMAVDTTRPAHH